MKKILFFLSLIALLFFTKKPLLAVFTQQDFQRAVESPEINLSKWVAGEAGVLENIAAGLNKQILGDIPVLGDIPEQNPPGTPYVPGGAIGGITNLIAAMYIHPPASSVEYFADLGRNLGIVKPAYAQAGTGFEGLRPILPLWRDFRNIAYSFFTIVFIVIGFAIMFRVKLNPQTVISVQNAIPRVVIALILVTFSYAIAGLLIDSMYVASAVIVSVINPGGTLNELVNLLKEKLNMGGGNEAPNILVFQLLFMGKGLEYAHTIASALLNPAVILADILNAPKELIDAIQMITTFIPGLSGGAIILTLILSVVLLFTFFKLLLSLLKAYVSVLISIIFGPLQIMLGVLPGQTSFGSWIRTLPANLAVFPAVIVMMALTSKIVELTGNGRLWVPPPLTPPTILGIGDTYSVRMIGAMIAYGMLLLTPKVADMVKEALQVKPFPYGAAIGEAMGPARWAWGFGTRMGPPVFAERVLYGERERHRFIQWLIRIGEMAGLWKPPQPQT